MYTIAKSKPFDVRAALKLPNGSVFDDLDTATPVPAIDWGTLELRMTYQRAAGGGYQSFIIAVADEEDGEYFYRTIDDGSINPSGEYSSSVLYISEKKCVVPADGNPLRTTYLIDVSTARWLKILFREVGAPGNPGTLLATAVLGNPQS